MRDGNNTLLQITNVSLQLPDRPEAREGLSFTLSPGEMLAVVGESGSGKSALALAIMGLLRPPARVTGGEIVFAGRNLLRLSERELCRLRGREIAMVHQDPLLTFNPIRRAGDPVAESVTLHEGLAGRSARKRAIELLREAGLGDPERVFPRYPHQLSGGMRQRVLLASALAGRPSLLIADEPTSSLDAPLKGHVLNLLHRVKDELGTAVILITHDLGEAALADRVLVLRNGETVETGPAREVLERPQTPYAVRLRRAVLDLTGPVDLATPPPVDKVAGPLLDLRDLAKYFTTGDLLASRRAVRAVDGVSFSIAPGEAVAIAGESGCGKSTLIRTALRLIPPSRGSIAFRGEEIAGRREGGLTTFRRQVQVVFQNPASSLDPRLRIRDAVAEPLVVHGWTVPAQRERVGEVLEEVGLGAGMGERYPHELSIGQRQLACLARALAPRPALIALDEPVSSLDALSRDRVLRVLRKLRREKGLSYLIVSHDVAVLRQVADRMLMMFAGRIVEGGKIREICRNPLHPYSRYLLGGEPGDTVSGEEVAATLERCHSKLRNLAAPREGCPYFHRCPMAQHRCTGERPVLGSSEGDHVVACHYAD